MATLGVYSEVGKLRKVLVHRPDLSLKRLTPSNCEELLFDGVLWVKKGDDGQQERCSVAPYHRCLLESHSNQKPCQEMALRWLGKEASRQKWA